MGKRHDAGRRLPLPRRQEKEAGRVKGEK
jgi:hypothetical protein